MKQEQNGFSIAGLVIILIVVIATVVVGFYVWRSNHPVSSDAVSVNNASDSNSEKEVTKPKETWLTYKNEEAGITFQYPSTWHSESADILRYEDGAFGGIGGTLTSQAGNKLTWIFQLAGGRGGNCDPNPGDTAFMPGNKCSSKQVISFEKAQSVTPPTNKNFRNMFEDSLFITRTRYLSSIGGETTFQICLDPFYTDKSHIDETPRIGTRMGLLFPCEYWDTGFNAKFEVKSEADFTSPDALTAEKIMKSFNSL